MRFTIKKIGSKWYSWDTESDKPVSAGKNIEVAAKDRADILNAGGLIIRGDKTMFRTSTAEMLEQFSEWAAAYGSTDPVVAKAYP